MAHKLISGYQKADSENLPIVDIEMFVDFMKENKDFYAPEIRCIKAARNGDASYGDVAVGYVQLKRSLEKCSIVAAVAPEHRIHSACYRVHMEIDLENCKIISVQCHDCIASAGGCKHALTFLGWMYRKSEKLGVTDVTPYWKKSPLSRVGDLIKFLEACLMIPKRSESVHAKRKRKTTPSGSFLREVCEDIFIHWTRNGSQSDVPSLFHHKNEEFSWRDALDLHRLSLLFRKQLNEAERDSVKAEHFYTFCRVYMTKTACLQSKLRTTDQADSSDWFKLRYYILFIM